MRGQLFTQGLASNPAAGALLADTGALTQTGAPNGCNYRVSLIMACTILATFRFEVIDDTDVVQHTLYFPVLANTSIAVSLDATFYIANGWKMKLKNQTLIALGSVQGTIATQPIEVE